MDFLSLWAPILLSAALVWIASAVMWMGMPHHKKDHIGLPNEQAFMDFVKSQNIPPGNYGFPNFGSHKECNTPEAKEKWKTGPIGLISVWGKFSMGRNMFLTFLVFLVASVLIGYLGSEVLPAGAGFGKVMRVIGTAGVLTYCFSFIPNMVWFGAYMRSIVACIFDGIVYGLITGAVFAWLWPAA
jgi:hypothetical protein